MDRSPANAWPSSRDPSAVDSLARSLATPTSRRTVLGLLAALTAGGSGVLAAPTVSGLRRKHRKRKTRRSRQDEAAVSERATSIPPNCIYVCCDGTCDSWKMCLRCVKWPKPPKVAGTLSPA